MTRDTYTFHIISHYLKKEHQLELECTLFIRVSVSLAGKCEGQMIQSSGRGESKIILCFMRNQEKTPFPYFGTKKYMKKIISEENIMSLFLPKKKVNSKSL